MTDFLQLPSLRTLSVADEGDAYTVDAESTQTLQQCPGCQGMRLYRHGAQPQTYRDAPSHGKPVRIGILRKRYRCQDCEQTAFDPIPDLDGKRRATTRLVAFVRARSYAQTFTAVAREAALDEKTVRQIFADHVAQLAQQVRFETPRVLGIDELKIIGAYRAMITNIEHKSIFDLRPSRSKADLLTYFKNLPDRDTIQWVTMDMYDVYRQVVHATLPQARIVVDRFHIQRMANEVLEKLRKNLRKTLTERERLKLKDERFLLLKRQHDLDPLPMRQLDAWFDRFPQLNRAHALKEGFLSIWDARNRADAEARFKTWLGHLDPELQENFKELTTAMRNWYEEVFSYFDNRITNAYTESANSLTRLMHRMGRGYSFEVLRARMLYDARARQATRRILETAARREDTAGMAYFTRATTRTRIAERRIIEYGPSIEVLVRLLEAGAFE